MSPSPDLPPAQRLLALKALPGFAELPASALWAIGHHASIHRHEQARVLHRAGTQADAIHVLVDGKATIEHGSNVSGVEPLELAVGWEALTHEPTSFTVTMTEPSTTLSLDVAHAEAILVDRFDVYRAVIRQLARAISTILQSIVDAGTPPRDDALPEPSRGDLPLAARLAHLAATPELAALPLDVLAALAASVETRTLEPGELLWGTGERHDSAVIPLDRGLTAVSDRLTLDLPRGQLFGLEDALSGDPRWNDLVPVQRTRCLLVPKQTLFDELEDDEDAARALLRSMAQRHVRLSGYERLVG